MTKTVVLFIPGSYVLLSSYTSFLNALTNAECEVHTIHLPTIGPSSRKGRDGPAPSMYDDAGAIAEIVEKLALQGKEVILIGHSYAGIPMSQCTKGLSKKERSAQGQLGGIIRLAFMASLVPPLGGSAASLLSPFGDDHRPRVSVDVSVHTEV